MSWLDSLRKRRAARPVESPRGSETVDPESGEISAAEGEAPASAAARAGEPPSGIPGERTIPSVNRERSMRSRIGQAAALGAALLLIAGFLLWYYAAEFQKARDAKAAARRTTEARTSGEMRVPPLGRVDPPQTNQVIPSVATSGTSAAPAGQAATHPAPPPPLPPSRPAGPTPKSPEQLALERQLGQPVLLRSSTLAVATAAPRATTTAGLSGPSMAGLLASLVPGRPAETAPSPSSDSSLGAMLRPTATPAVAAQVLPTLRYLLPKGAFIDCTLETAIDSTVDGMVTCIGASDIYSADGREVLLERGTKFVGEKRGEVKQGQGRVFVLWNEARTPAGVIVNLASPGTDELGRTGLPGQVDTHFWDRFGAAILISVIDGAVQALAGSGHRDGGNAIVFNPQGSRDVMTEVLKGTIAIPPTVIKPQGDRVQILVARDVDFRSAHASRAATTAR